MYGVEIGRQRMGVCNVESCCFGIGDEIGVTLFIQLN